MSTRVLHIVAVSILLAGPAFGHHSFAMFDQNKDVTLTGEVKELRWTNPHIHLIINVPDGKGGTAEWDIEGGTPGNLRRTGWSKTIVKPGEKISVVVHPMKDGSNGGQLVRASRADGTVIGGTVGGE